MKKLKVIKEIEVPEFKFVYEIIKVDSRDWGIEDGVLLIQFDKNQALILTKAKEKSQTDCILFGKFNAKRQLWEDATNDGFINLDK